MTGKVTGIGGIFIRFNDPEKMNKWYEEVLGLTGNGYGILFAFNGGESKRAYLQLGTFPQNTDYFGNKEQTYMLNFRVDDLEKMTERLRRFNVPIVDEPSVFEYGTFLHIEDPEGNRIELWQPIDNSFDAENYVQMR
jgi:predicted enzyme related to lactoylglutathione lyase